MGKNFSTINENELSLFDSNNITEQNQLAQHQPYYYSPSSTVMRQQQQQQQQQQQLMQHKHQQLLTDNKLKSLKEEETKINSTPVGKPRSKSSTKATPQTQQLSVAPDFGNELNTPTFNNQKTSRVNDFSTPPPSLPPLVESNYLNKNQQNRPQQQQQQQRPLTNENDAFLYMKGSEGKQQKNTAIVAPQSVDLQRRDNSKNNKSTPQQSRNTSIKKLKNFFGEKVCPFKDKIIFFKR